MRTETEICRACGGEGGYYVDTGWRQYGSGYGDCYPTQEARVCERCEGRGEIKREPEPPPHTADGRDRSAGEEWTTVEAREARPAFQGDDRVRVLPAGDALDGREGVIVDAAPDGELFGVLFDACIYLASHVDASDTWYIAPWRLERTD